MRSYGQGNGRRMDAGHCKRCLTFVHAGDALLVVCADVLKACMKQLPCPHLFLFLFTHICLLQATVDAKHERRASA